MEGVNAAELQENLNIVWILLCAALVFLMQAGFMSLEAGMARAKNSINVSIKNMADFVLAVSAFWLVGFGLMFGASKSGIVGFSDFAINDVSNFTILFFVFQAVFVGTAATIDSGAIAGRTKFGSYLILSVLVSTLIYPIFGHWAWGGLLHGDQQGWLEKLGFIDFAGSTVVHSVGGWVALAALIIIGPRIGRFKEDGTPVPIQPHNMSMAYLGTFILFFGWFGFNCGSTLEASGDIPGIAFNTVIAGCFGCISCSAISWLRSEYKRPEGEMIINGVLGGLVSITAGCAAVSPIGAATIGFGGGAVVYFGVKAIEKIFKLDDVVGAVAVHGFAGAWGTIATGIFITSANLGDASRLTVIGVQVLGVVACFIWTFGMSFLIISLINKFAGLRVSAEDEQRGLNISEHGASSGILDLAQAMVSVSNEGKFDESAKVEVESGTEIGDLATCFNGMIDTVQESMSESEEQKQLAEKQREQATVAQEMAESEKLRAEEALEQAGVEKERAEVALKQADEERVKSEETAALAEKQRAEAMESEEKAHEQEQAARDALARVEELKTQTEERQREREEIVGQVRRQIEEAVTSMEALFHSNEGVQEKVEQLEPITNSIDNAANLIDSIANQTNLLSLNATIEAASAGEHGKGFGVVANEMRDLNKRTRDAANQVKESNHEFNSGLQSVQKNMSKQFDFLKDAAELMKSTQSTIDHIENEQQIETTSTG